jgi:hypothetical protein
VKAPPGEFAAILSHSSALVEELPSKINRLDYSFIE